MAFLYSRSADK